MYMYPLGKAVEGKGCVTHYTLGTVALCQDDRRRHREVDATLEFVTFYKVDD